MSFISKNNDLQYKNKNYFPIFFDLCDKKIVVFGGGKVSERKGLKLSDYSNVFIYSSTFTKNLLDYYNIKHKKNLSLNFVSDLWSLNDNEFKEIISGAFLVIPATNDLNLNHKISEISKKNNILVNSVTSSEDIIFPSVISKSGITIGISTNGISPTVARLLKNQIKLIIDTEKLQLLLKLQSEIKRELKVKKIDSNIIKLILNDICISKKINELLLSKSYIEAKKEVYLKYSNLM